MTKQTEAMNLALEALTDFDYDKRLKAITAIREALANEAIEQPAQRPIKTFHEGKPWPLQEPAQQQEPVAWALSHSRGLEFSSKYPMQKYRELAEQMACQYMGKVTVTPLYTSPPAQRKPLTDEEIEKLREKTFSTGNPYCPVDSKAMRKAVRATEAAHGIKENT